MDKKHVFEESHCSDESSPNAVSGSMSRRRFGEITLAASAGLLLPRASFAFEQEVASVAAPNAVKNVVLVHGVFADGSSWSRVIPLLEAKGYNVMAVQIPLTSLADDVATTRRILAKQTGPTILVGHSYAGVVVTEAGTAPNVVGVVYISSYGPAAGESHDDLVKRYPPPSGAAALVLDGDGYLWIMRDKFRETFCHDVDVPQALIMAAVQKPVLKAPCWSVPVKAAAWTSKPSWFLVSTDDHLINPDLQRFMAARMKATTVSVASSHASLVSHPVDVANLIEKATAAA
jgi:pimeloyl-ACP methyl ester carboxylesterase